MTYSIICCARRARDTRYSMADDQPRDEKQTRPPGEADEAAKEFEVRARRSESSARLENLARVYGLRAIK